MCGHPFSCFRMFFRPTPILTRRFDHYVNHVEDGIRVFLEYFEPLTRVGCCEVESSFHFNHSNEPLHSLFQLFIDFHRNLLLFVLTYLQLSKAHRFLFANDALSHSHFSNDHTIRSSDRQEISPFGKACSCELGLSNSPIYGLVHQKRILLELTHD